MRQNILISDNTDLVYEVEGNSSLPCAHLSRFEVAAVLATDVVHAGLQFPSNLIFLPVLLPLHSVNKGKKAEDRRVKTVRRKSRDMGHSIFFVNFFLRPNEILLNDNLMFSLSNVILSPFTKVTERHLLLCKQKMAKKNTFSIP